MMNEDELSTELRKSDAAGDTIASKQYADQIRSERQISVLSDNLRSADASGNVAAAKQYADQIRTLRGPSKPVPTSNWDMTANAVNKGLTAGADFVLNTPSNAANLIKAAVGISPIGDVLRIAHRSDLLPQITPPPNFVARAKKGMGFFVPKDYSLTPGQEIGDTAIQGATMAAITGGRSIPELLLNMGMGALSTTAQNEVSKVAGDKLGMAAGIAAPFLTGKMIPVIPKTVNFFTPKVRAGGQIVRSMENPKETRVKLFAPSAGLPGSKPTLGQLLRDPGITQMEAFMKEQPETLGRFKVAEAKQASNRRTQLEKAIPGEFGPELVQNASGAKLDDIMRHINDRRTMADSAESGARKNLESWTPDSMNLGVSVSGGNLGSIVQRKLTELQKQVETDIENRTSVQREEVLNSPHTVDLNRVMDTVSVQMSKSKGHEIVEKAMGKVSDLLGKFYGQSIKPEDMTQEQIRSAYLSGGALKTYSSDVHHAWNIRKSLNDMMEGNTDDPSLQFASKQLGEIKKSLDVQMNEATGGKWEKYLNTYKQEVEKRDPFYRVRGKVPLAIKTDEFGRAYAYSPEELPAMFFSPGDKGAAYARSLKELLSGDPEVTGAIKGYVADRVKNVIDKGGDVNKNLNTWIRDHGPALKEYGLYDQVKTPVLARNMMEDNLASLLEKKKLLFKHLDEKVTAVQKTAVGKMMGADPDRAFSTIMNSKDATHNLMQLTALARQNPETLAGLRVAARDFVFERHVAGTDMLENPKESFAKQMNAWTRFGPIFEKAGLYDSKQMKTMNMVFKDIENQHYAATGGRTAGVSPTARLQRMTNWVHHRMLFMVTNSVAKIMDGMLLAHGIATGDVLMTSVLMGGVEGLNALNNATTEQLIKANLDPQIAAELVKTYDATRAHALEPLVDQAVKNSIISLSIYMQSKQENQK